MPTLITVRNRLVPRLVDNDDVPTVVVLYSLASRSSRALFGTVTDVDDHRSDFQNYGDVGEAMRDVGYLVHLAAMTGADSTHQRRKESIPVTGAAGYIGSRVVAELRSRHPDWEIVGADNFYAETIRENDGHAVDQEPEWLNWLILSGSHWIDDRRVSKGRMINFIVERASNGDSVTVYEPGTQAHNVVYVGDVARASVRSAEGLLEQRADDEIGVETSTIASDEGPSVTQIAALVRETRRDVAGLEPAAEHVETPCWVEALVDDFTVDTTRTHEELGEAPTRTVEDSIRRLVRERTTDDAKPERRSMVMGS